MVYIEKILVTTTWNEDHFIYAIIYRDYNPKMNNTLLWCTLIKRQTWKQR